MKTPPMSPERENLPLVKISRALDRVVDRIKERELPDAEDMIIAADWIDRQRMSNLKRGLFEGCDECGARVTKYGCPNCMRIALTMCEQWTKRDIDIYATHTPPVEMMNALKHRLAEIQKALNAGSPNEKLTHAAPNNQRRLKMPSDQNLAGGIDSPDKGAALSSSALLAALVFRWRDAAAHHRKVASSRERSYRGEPLYEDGLAEAFGRCADILANEMAKSANEKGEPR